MDYQSMSVGELRKEMRGQFPETRGEFASNANKAECLAIIESTQTSLTVMGLHGGPNRLGGATTTDGDVPDEGVHGEGAEKATDHEAAIDAAARTAPVGFKEVMKALEGLNPQAHTEIVRLQEAEVKLTAEIKELSGSIDKTTDLSLLPAIKDGGMELVTIGGMPVPIMAREPVKPTPGELQINGKLKELYEYDMYKWNHVPDIDDEYRFDIWRGQTECGAMKFEQSAGDFIQLLLAGENVMLIGPPAVGKTSLPCQFAARVGWPVVRFNGNQDITMGDLVGNYEAHKGSTRWVDGPLPAAMKMGAIFIIDEADHMPAECSSTLHPVLEQRGNSLMIASNGGEIVKPHPNFRVVSTMNTAGFGDETGLFSAAQVQDFAFNDRFSVAIRVVWMKPKHERQLIRKLTGIGSEIVKRIVKVANDTREKQTQGGVTYPITLRQTIGWATTTMMLDGDVGAGFALSVLNKIPSQDAGAVAEIAQRHFGNGLTDPNHKWDESEAKRVEPDTSVF